MENRRAVSGVIPARRLRIADRVFRLTSKALAASLTVNPKGSRHNSFKTSPGWGGLCIFARILVVVFIVHILNVFTNKLKCYAPVTADANRPSALSRPLQAKKT